MTYGKYLIPSTVGFDKLLSTLQEFDNLSSQTYKTPTYPPYNIIKEDEFNYTIEIAVSGFKRDELEITSEGGKLTVNGSIKTAKTAEKYIHRGVAARDFHHKFILAPTVVVRSADIIDGLLTINLENVIPDEMKPRKIEIGNTPKVVTEVVAEKQQKKKAIDLA